MNTKSMMVAIFLGSAIAAPAFAQPAATPVKITSVQPGLVEVSGGRINQAVAAGITKITATPGKGNRSVEVHSPWGNIFFGWPKDVKPVAFTIAASPKAGTATISAPGFTEANKADYKAAVDAVVPMAIKRAEAQKAGRTTG